MKRFVFILTAISLFLGVLRLHADELKLTLYEAIQSDIMAGRDGELVLKVTNPTDRVFYVYGYQTSDVPHTIEILKGNKWVEAPPRRCATGWSFRRFQPHSEIVFAVPDAPLDMVGDEDITFRVRAYLYLSTDLNLYKDPSHKPYVEAVSEPFHAKDFRSAKDAAQKYPGWERIPKDKAEVPASDGPIDPFAVPPAKHESK